MVGSCEQKQCHAHGRQRAVARHQDAPSFEAVCSVPRHECESDGGKKQCEANPGQVERAAGQGVDLPADRDALHLAPEDDQDSGCAIEIEIPVRERRRPRRSARHWLHVAAFSADRHRELAARFRRRGGRARVPRQLSERQRHG